LFDRFLQLHGMFPWSVREYDGPLSLLQLPAWNISVIPRRDVVSKVFGRYLLDYDWRISNFGLCYVRSWFLSNKSRLDYVPVM